MAFSNEAFKNRRYGIATGGWYPLDLLLHTDLVSCEKHLPPSYNLGFRLKRTSSDFVLLQPDANKKKYDIELRNIHICIERRENQVYRIYIYILAAFKSDVFYEGKIE